MRLVPVKSAEQMDFQALHRYRERLVHDRTAIVNRFLLQLLQTPHLRWHQAAVLLPPPVVRLMRDARLAAHFLNPRAFLGLAQKQGDLLIAELRSFHPFVLDWSMKTQPRIFSLQAVQLSGSRSHRHQPSLGQTVMDHHGRSCRKRRGAYVEISGRRGSRALAIRRPHRLRLASMDTRTRPLHRRNAMPPGLRAGDAPVVERAFNRAHHAGGRGFPCRRSRRAQFEQLHRRDILRKCFAGPCRAYTTRKWRY